MPRLLIHFARYGPYHHARLKSAAIVLAPLGWEVIGLAIADTDATYAWEETQCETTDPRMITAFPGRAYEDITAAEYRRVLFPLLNSLAPTAISIAGWGSTDAILCLSWCRKNDVRRIVMSETRTTDGHRRWWKECIKRFLISRFDGALVGGKSHRDYLIKLGMPADKIRFGYNVVNNAHFADECKNIRRSKIEEQKEEPYFLASNRFVKRKNLARLIEAYSFHIRQLSIDNQPSSIWPLCLLGDGELKSTLIAQCRSLGLQVIESAPWETSPTPVSSASSSGTVYFPGFRQIDELPRFYANAGCFIHPALEEPWGLVINEAMACGLPVLSSYNVGAAEELIDEGVNGWKFDPENSDNMAECLTRIAALPLQERTAFGQASHQLLETRCPTQAFGENLAILLNPIIRS